MSETIVMQHTATEVTRSGQDARACPVHAAHAQTAGLDAADELVLPLHKRVVTQYATTTAGARELRLFYGDKEISFDEPELFTFGETLGKQSRFVAGAAMSWGEGYKWPQVKELLEQLITCHQVAANIGQRLTEFIGTAHLSQRRLHRLRRPQHLVDFAAEFGDSFELVHQ